MTYLAPVPRVRPSGWLVRLSGVANANRAPMPVETRQARQLSAVEMAEVRHLGRELDTERECLSHFAEWRGEANDLIEPLPKREGLITTLLISFLIGAPLFLMAAHWLIGAVFAAVMAVRFPEFGGF